MKDWSFLRKIKGKQLIVRKEQLAIIFFVILYLYVFRSNIYSSDAMVYVEHIDKKSIVWNPNHLLMDPFAYYFHWLLSLIWSNIQPIISLKILSGTSALVSLLMFERMLYAFGMLNLLPRIVILIGFFASSNFLSLALSEEFFMVYVPFLLVAIWCFGLLIKEKNKYHSKKPLILIGMCLVFATGFLSSNIFAILSVGLAMMTMWLLKDYFTVRDILILGLTSSLVGIPLFLTGYFLNGSEISFISWLSSYQGTVETASSTLYGVAPTFNSLSVGLARLGFNLLTIFVELGSLGTVLKSWFFGMPLEFVPDVIMVCLKLGILAGICLLWFFALKAVNKRTIYEPFFIFAVFWIVGYLIFNFLWNDSSDQFWIPVLPVLWLIVLFGFDLLPELKVHSIQNIRSAELVRAHGLEQHTSFNWILLFVLSLLTVNTFQVASPKAFVNLDRQRALQNGLVPDDALKIVTGWDGMPWLAEAPPEGKVINLMSWALGENAEEATLEQLTRSVGEALHSGKRVIVVRLFAKDSNPRPWDQLRKLGWAREDIKRALSGFEKKELGTVHELLFSELLLPGEKYKQMALE